MCFWGCWAGLSASVIPAVSYRKMIKEADLMGTSNHKLIKYIKLKFSSYFKLGMIPENTGALVNKYVDKYKINSMSIHRWGANWEDSWNCHINCRALCFCL